MQCNGKENLRQVLLAAGYSSLEAAVAHHALFLHPDTVSQTRNQNLFRIVRDGARRGSISQYSRGPGQVLADDNEGPANCFRWCIVGFDPTDVQYNHIYRDSKCVELYTCQANICVTPAFLAKLSDTDPGVVAALKYRVFDLYGFVPTGHQQPNKPAGYDKLQWQPLPPPAPNLERVFRQHMKSKPKCRTTVSAAQIGWLFSGFVPDKTFPTARANRAA